MSRRLFKYEVLLDGKSMGKPNIFGSPELPREFARENLQSEISQKRVSISKVEAFTGANDVATTRRLNKFARKKGAEDFADLSVYTCIIVN